MSSVLKTVTSERHRVGYWFKIVSFMKVKVTRI